MSKAADQVPEDKLELYKQIIANHPEMELKGGQKLPYTSMNGHMYTMLTKDGRIGLRMSKDDQEAFKEKYDAIQFLNYGSKIKDYVEVPEALLDDLDELGPYVAKSHAYVQTLKPKPTKK